MKWKLESTIDSDRETAALILMRLSADCADYVYFYGGKDSDPIGDGARAYYLVNTLNGRAFGCGVNEDVT